MPTVLITGATRGLGLEFARQYATDEWRVIACCRHPGPDDDLARLADSSGGAISVHALDVCDHTAIEDLAVALDDLAIDVLINNAGVMGPRDEVFGSIDYELWEEIMTTNVMGPLRMAEAFVDHVEASQRKLIVAISSRMGSIGALRASGHYPYRMSKAALNMVMQTAGHDLARRGISVLVLHPGWVRTELGGPDADIGVEESVSGMRFVIAHAGNDSCDTLMGYDNQPYPW